jgi:nitrite reductase (NADH) large subunit
VLKQISGYTLLALCLSALWLSVQKRFAALKLGNYSVWRAIHTATGLLTLGLLFVHTGFHLGANFNAWLMLTFALLNLLGGVSGVFSGLEAKTDSGIGILSRRLKPVATWAHILLFWPIPTLVMFHMISVYYW